MRWLSTCYPRLYACLWRNKPCFSTSTHKNRAFFVDKATFYPQVLSKKSDDLWIRRLLIIWFSTSYGMTCGENIALSTAFSNGERKRPTDWARILSPSTAFPQGEAGYPQQEGCFSTETWQLSTDIVKMKKNNPAGSAGYVPASSLCRHHARIVTTQKCRLPDPGARNIPLRIDGNYWNIREEGANFTNL